MWIPSCKDPSKITGRNKDKVGVENSFSSTWCFDPKDASAIQGYDTCEFIFTTSLCLWLHLGSPGQASYLFEALALRTLAHLDDWCHLWPPWVIHTSWFMPWSLSVSFSSSRHLIVLFRTSISRSWSEMIFNRARSPRSTVDSTRSSRRDFLELWVPLQQRW